MMESCLTATSANTFRTLGCTSSELVHVQLPHMVSKMILSYDRWDLIPQPALRFRDSRDMERAIVSENWGKKLFSTSGFSTSVVTRSPLSYHEKHIFFTLPFLTDVPLEPLLTLQIPCQTHLQLWFNWSNPIPTLPGSFSIFFQDLSLLTLPIHFCLMFGKTVVE